MSNTVQLRICTTLTTPCKTTTGQLRAFREDFEALAERHGLAIEAFRTELPRKTVASAFGIEVADLVPYSMRRRHRDTDPPAAA